MDLTLARPYTPGIGENDGMPNTAMNATDRPEWMQRVIERQSQANLQAELLSTQERLAEMCMETYGPTFVGDFLHWLRHYVGKLIDIEKSGGMEVTSTPKEGPQIYQVRVRNGAPFFRSSYSTVQFNLPNVRFISCHAVEGSHRNIDLAPLPTMDGIGAIWPDQVMPLTAKQTASEVIREIVNRIDSREW